MTRMIALVALCAAAAATARQPVFESPRADLRTKFAEHDWLRYVLTRETLMAGEDGELLGTTVYGEFDVTKRGDAAGASVPMQARYRAYALELRTANGLTTYDSRDPTGTNERGKNFEGAGQTIIRTVYEMDVATNGVVTEMRAKNENPVIEDEPLRSLLNHEALQREFSYLFTLRCDQEKPLVGHEWSNTTSTQVAHGIWMVVTHAFTLQDIEKDIAIVTVKSKAELTALDPEQQSRLRQRIVPNEMMGGVIRWNLTDGVMEEYEIVLDYDMVTSRDGLKPERQRFVQSFGAVRVR